MNASIHELVRAGLADLGLPAPTNFIQTILLTDRQFVGWKYRYDGGYAILPAGGNAIEIHADDGKVLTTVTLEKQREEAA